MTSRCINLTGLQGIPLVNPGDDVGEFLAAAVRRVHIVPANQDIFVVAQKVVSKAEGRFISLAGVTPSARATALAAEVHKDPRLVEVILSESTEVVRHRQDVLIVAHRLGFVMANAGVDQSNVGPAPSSVEGPAEAGHVLLLPQCPDASAAALKEQLDREFGVSLGVVISDSFGRPWRNGAVGVALGAAGIPVLRNLVGTPDLFGRHMQATEVAVADEIAAAASLIMGECDEGIPAVHVRGVAWNDEAGRASALVRPREMDLFR
jgi:coenzyme F420-0:L-glutamate ligase/coenzyme F420-1:gamma-L-glutamate ligase